jgi:hypothetical protein
MREFTGQRVAIGVLLVGFREVMRLSRFLLSALSSSHNRTGLHRDCAIQLGRERHH